MREATASPGAGNLMRKPGLREMALLALLVPLLLIVCGDGDRGLSRAEVEEIVRAERASAAAERQNGVTSADLEEAIRAAIAAIARTEAWLSRAEVEEIVNAAVAAIPESKTGITSADAEVIARAVVASIPPRSDPPAYTKFFVENAISMYKTQGLEATLAHYNRGESIDGQWYLFIVDENDLVIGHPDPQRLGLDLKGWVGFDANGYNFWPEMMSATEEGKWVSYVYKNPESGSISPDDLGEVELKNVWVVRHDGLLFGSGWYIDVDQFTKDIVAAVVDLFGMVGLEATVESFSNNAGGTLGGVATSAVSYNTSDAVKGEWSVFIADGSGAIVFHFNPAMIGTGLDDLLGADTSAIDEEGTWLTSESMRIWVVKLAGWVFGAGWRNNEPGS